MALGVTLDAEPLPDGGGGSELTAGKSSSTLVGNPATRERVLRMLGKDVSASSNATLTPTPTAADSRVFVYNDNRPSSLGFALYYPGVKWVVYEGHKQYS